MKTRAFSLVEILVVVLIISILCAILFPVVARAKLSAKVTTDVSNLRECARALSLYQADNNDREPVALDTTSFGASNPQVLIRVLSPLNSYSGKGVTFLSPLDDPRGRMGRVPYDRTFPNSYKATWILWEDKSGFEAWDSLLSLDQNPIVFRSYFCDDRVREIMLSDLAHNGTLENGVSRVARKDTSVQIVRKPDALDSTGKPAHDLPDIKMSVWHLATDYVCPEAICDGKKPSFFRSQ